MQQDHQSSDWGFFFFTLGTHVEHKPVRMAHSTARTGEDPRGAWPVSLTSPLPRAPANGIHFSVELLQSCGKMLFGLLPGHSTPKCQRLLLLGQASPSHWSDLVSKPPATAPERAPGGMCSAPVCRFFPVVEPQLPSVLTCLVRRLNGRSPFSSLPARVSCTSKINCLSLTLHPRVGFWGIQIKTVTLNQARKQGRQADG